LAVYAITFTSCVAPHVTVDHPDSFQVH
jgi:hypothetical protein